MIYFQNGPWCGANQWIRVKITLRLSKSHLSYFVKRIGKFSVDEATKVRSQDTLTSQVMRNPLSGEIHHYTIL